ncbi:MAG: hypothetical protein Q8L84_17435 [Hyphomonas sp.]|nr:hypothetical protein [Hyphomonas sp.]
MRKFRHVLESVCAIISAGVLILQTVAGLPVQLEFQPGSTAVVLAERI